MYRPSSVWTWSFVVLMVLQAAVVLALESYSFAVFLNSLTSNSTNTHTDAPKPLPGASKPTSLAVYTRTIPTFLTLYIFGMLYQLVLVWDALRLKNTIQIIGLCLVNIGLLIYGAVQIDQVRQALEQLYDTLDNKNAWPDLKGPMTAIPIVLGVVTILMSFLAWKLYDEFAWTIYKHISADLRMKRRYLTYQIYIALLKFDFLFFLGFTVQFLVIVQGTERNDPEFGLTVAAVPITIIILLLAAFWTRREQIWGMVVIIILYFAALAYFLFKLVRIWYGSRKDDYQPASKPLTTFAAITIILILATIATAIQCMMNFNKGLKPHIARRKVESEEEKHYMTEMPSLAHGPVPSRMTIE